MPVYNLGLPRSALWAAGVCGTLFLGYCVYFDRKRRSDPMFRAKLKERRKQQKMSSGSNSARHRIPELTSPQAIHKYFFEQLQAGEEALAEGDIEGSAQHFSNAIVVSGQPMELLRTLGENLPPRLFDRILEVLPITGRRVAPTSMQPAFMGGDPSGPPKPAIAAPQSTSPPPRAASIVEDDVD